MGYLSRLVATLQSSSFVGTSWIVVLIPIPQMLPVCFYKFRNPTSFWKSEKGRNRLQPIHCQSIPFFRTTKVAQKKSIKSIMTSREGFFVGFFDRSNLNLGDFTNLENSSKLIAPSPAKIRKKTKTSKTSHQQSWIFLALWKSGRKKLSSYKLKMFQGVLKGIWTLRKPSVKWKVQKVWVKVEALLVTYLWLYIVPSQHLPFFDW